MHAAHPIPRNPKHGRAQMTTASRIWNVAIHALHPPALAVLLTCPGSCGTGFCLGKSCLGVRSGIATALSFCGRVHVSKVWVMRD
jgi:hypothetical protein